MSEAETDPREETDDPAAEEAAATPDRSQYMRVTLHTGEELAAARKAGGVEVARKVKAILGSLAGEQHYKIVDCLGTFCDVQIGTRTEHRLNKVAVEALQGVEADIRAEAHAAAHEPEPESEETEPSGEPVDDEWESPAAVEGADAT